MKKIGFLAAILVACACNRHNNPEIRAQNAPLSLASGWTVAKSDDGVVSIGVAPGWRSGVDKMMADLNLGAPTDAGGAPASDASNDPKAAELQQMISKLDAQSSQMEKQNEQKQLAKLKEQGIVIQVLDGGPRTFDEARTRYVVKVGHFDYNPTLAETAEVEKKRFFAAVTPTPVKLPIGDALKMEETRELRNGSMLTIISYLVVNGHDMYSIQFTTEGPADTIKNLADPVAQTLRIKN